MFLGYFSEIPESCPRVRDVGVHWSQDRSPDLGRQGPMSGGLRVDASWDYDTFAGIADEHHGSSNQPELSDQNEAESIRGDPNGYKYRIGGFRNFLGFFFP